MGERARNPGRRTLIAAVVLALFGAGCFTGAWGLVKRERIRYAEAFPLDFEMYEFRFDYENGSPVDGILIRLMRYPEFVEVPDHCYLVVASPEEVRSGSSVLSGWLWGEFPLAADYVTVQQIHLIAESHTPESLDELRTSLTKVVERMIAEHASGYGLDPVEVDAMRASSLPIRIPEGSTSIRFRRDEFRYRIGSWVLPTIGLLTLISFALGLASLLFAAVWTRGAWRRRRWRKTPDACSACGYDMPGLDICPECGA